MQPEPPYTMLGKLIVTLDERHSDPVNGIVVGIKPRPFEQSGLELLVLTHRKKDPVSVESKLALCIWSAHASVLSTRVWASAVINDRHQTIESVASFIRKIGFDPDTLVIKEHVFPLVSQVSDLTARVEQFLQALREEERKEKRAHPLFVAPSWLAKIRSILDFTFTEASVHINEPSLSQFRVAFMKSAWGTIAAIDPQFLASWKKLRLELDRQIYLSYVSDRTHLFPENLFPITD